MTSPDKAPTGTARATMASTGICRKVRCRDSHRMTNGVMMIAGMYVGQCGTVKMPKTDIATIARGFAEPP